MKWKREKFDESLKEELKNRKIEFQEEWLRDDVIKLLKNLDEHKEQNNKQNEELTELARAGAILNIVMGSIFIPFWILLSFFLIGIPFLIGDIFSIVSNVKFKNEKDNKIMAGVLAIIFRV